MECQDDLIQLEDALISLNSTQTGRRVFLMGLPFILSACAQTSGDRYREGSNKGQKTSLSVDDEKKMTAEYLPKMQKDYPRLQDATAQNYITDLGNRIVAANGLSNNPYKYNFTLVKTKAVNAFALPAGTVYVTAPLLNMAQTEAELAGVIGHEIGHIKARHTAERMEFAKQQQSKSILYGLGGGLAGLAAGFGLSKIICKPRDRECMQRISKYGAIAGAAGGLLIQKYAFMANSQEDEMEADRIGFRTSVKAGFHKDYVGNFYENLLKMEKEHNKNQNKILKGFADAMSTHPPSEKRVTQMNEMAQSIKLSPRAVVSSREFSQVKKRIQRYL